MRHILVIRTIGEKCFYFWGMEVFDERTIQDLDFETIREWLISYCIGPSAADRLTALQPDHRYQKLMKELNRTKEFLSIRQGNESFPALDFEELSEDISLLPVKNAVLPQEGFMRIVRASTLVNALVYFFDKREKDFPELSALFVDVYHSTELITAIEKVFDRQGMVRDEASKALGEIRQQLRLVKKQINRNFEKELRRLSKELVLGETRETYLNERRVLTVLSSHKRKVSGMVLGSSKSGSLTFIEPQINIPLNNEYEQLLDDERKEIRRILQLLTRDLAVHLPLISSYQKLLVELDFIQAKARLAAELRCELPGIEEDTQLELIDAFHPILWKSNQAQGKATIAQHIRMDRESRMLVISGPNAGGKSITLKTIGLLQLMLQSGLLVPVHPNSKMSLFQRVLSDIGDKQSVENELSTYSYRLKRMKLFLDLANRKSLFLLDEFGTGSDPELGGALAEVFFEALYQRKSFAVITTHYANIKLKAESLKQARNACMLFDTERLSPLYKLQIGQPGSSFTFEVAAINGIPEELIERAKGKLDTRKVKLDELLHQLQEEKNYLERLNKEHIDAQQHADEARQYYNQQKEQLSKRSQKVSEQLQANESLLRLGKRLQQSIDAYQVKSRKRDANVALLEELRSFIIKEKSKVLDRASLASAQKKHQKSLLKDKPEAVSSSATKKKGGKSRQSAEEAKPVQAIEVGASVRLVDTKQSGRVEEVNGDKITVLFGFVKMIVNRQKLVLLS